MTAQSLQSLFYPKSVAIIGISRSIPSLGQMILDNIITSGYKGDIHLVNPKATEIAGRPVTNDVADLPRGLDLAILLLPPKFTPSTVAVLQQKCDHIVIISAGFGSDLEEQILEQADGLTVVGPNSMGIFSLEGNFSFSPVPISSGNFGFISQSGSIIAVVQELIDNHKFGFSCFVSLGNKLGLTEMEMFEFLAGDEQTTVIGAYLESFSHPQNLRQQLTGIAQHKPIIMVKGGRTDEGSAAVSSHTGALAGNFRLTTSLLRDSGVMLVPTIEEMVDLARFIDHYGVSSHHGVVTVSSAGGPGVLAADEVIEYNLPLAQLNPTTVEQLQEIIPPFGNRHNPIDLVADAGIDRYVASIEVLDKDPAVSTILIIIVHPVLIETEPLLDALDKMDVDTPLICAYLGPQFANFDHYSNILVYQTTREIMQILVRVNSYHHWLSTIKQRNLPTTTSDPPAVTSSVHHLLRHYQFQYPPTLSTSTYQDALEWFDSINQKIVMKLDHPKFSHKTDVGGVILDISAHTFEQSWQDLMSIYKEAGIPTGERMIELQPYYQHGLELVIGLVRDPQFGHFLLIGAGGTLVELWNDTVFMPLPTSRFAINEAIDRLKSTQLLDGYRGARAVDREQLIDVILSFNTIIHDVPQIKELDINPFYILPKTGEFIVLDARMELE